MFRFLLRALGFLLVAVAFAALVVDGSRSIAGGRMLFYGIGDAAAWLGGGRDAAAWSAPAGWPEAARRAAIGLSAAPAWLAAGALGLLLLVAGRPPAAGVGFPGRH